MRAGERSVSISRRRCRLIFVFGGALLLHLLEAVAVAQQLEVLPRREQQHSDEEDADGDRAPHLAMPLASTSRTIGLLRTSFLIAYSKVSPLMTARPISARAQLGASRPRVALDFGLARHHRPLRANP